MFDLPGRKPGVHSIYENIGCGVLSMRKKNGEVKQISRIKTGQ
jgi:hypothetical protein